MQVESKKYLKRNFLFLITYFKPTGKYYTSDFVYWNCRCLFENPNSPYIHDAVEKLRGLKNCGGQNSLPGLYGDGWDGPIHIVPARTRGNIHLTTSSVKKLTVDDLYADGLPHLIL